MSSQCEIEKGPYQRGGETRYENQERTGLPAPFLIAWLEVVCEAEKKSFPQIRFRVFPKERPQRTANLVRRDILLRVHD